MPIVQRLMSEAITAKNGTSVKGILKSGTKIEVIKTGAENTVQVVRSKKYGDVFTTTLKYIKGKFVPQKVKEQYKFGIINITFKPNGSKEFEIRAANVRGRGSSSNDGFFKMSKEVFIIPKGEIVHSVEEVIKIPIKERNVDLLSLLHMRTIRKNDRYCLHNEKFNCAQEYLENGIHQQNM